MSISEEIENVKIAKNIKTLCYNLYCFKWKLQNTKLYVIICTISLVTWELWKMSKHELIVLITAISSGKQNLS